MLVHSATYAAQYVPQTWAAAPLWGMNPQKRGNLRMPAIVFVPNLQKFTQIFRSIGATKAQKMSPKGHHVPPKWGQKTSQKGNLCATATVFIAQRPKFNRACQSTVPLTPHNMSPKLGPASPFGGINPQKRGNLCMLAIVFVPNSPNFTRIFRPVGATKPHKMSHIRDRVPKGGGAQFSAKFEIFASPAPYLSHSDQTIYTNMSIHSMTYATQYVPPNRAASPL